MSEVPLYRGTSLISNSARPGPYSRTMTRAMWQSSGGGPFIMSQVPLQLSEWGHTFFLNRLDVYLMLPDSSGLRKK